MFHAFKHNGHPQCPKIFSNPTQSHFAKTKTKHRNKTLAFCNVEQQPQSGVEAFPISEIPQELCGRRAEHQNSPLYKTGTNTDLNIDRNFDLNIDTIIDLNIDTDTDLNIGTNTDINIDTNNDLNVDTHNDINTDVNINQIINVKTNTKTLRHKISYFKLFLS